MWAGLRPYLKWRPPPFEVLLPRTIRVYNSLKANELSIRRYGLQSHRHLHVRKHEGFHCFFYMNERGKSLSPLVGQLFQPVLTKPQIPKGGICTAAAPIKWRGGPISQRTSTCYLPDVICTRKTCIHSIWILCTGSPPLLPWVMAVVISSLSEVGPQSRSLISLICCCWLGPCALHSWISRLKVPAVKKKLIKIKHGFQEKIRRKPTKGLFKGTFIWR